MLLPWKGAEQPRHTISNTHSAGSAAEMDGLGVSSLSILALFAFLASNFGAGDFLTTIFLEAFKDFAFTKAREKWLSLTNEPEKPLGGIQKHWTKPLSVKTPQDLISRMDDECSNVSNAHQDGFGSQWLNIVTRKNQA